MNLLQNVIDDLLAGKVPDNTYWDHALAGEYAGFRECHILPDWLLIYMIDPGQLLLTVTRTGSHSDLFDE